MRMLRSLSETGKEMDPIKKDTFREIEKELIYPPVTMEEKLAAEAFYAKQSHLPDGNALATCVNKNNSIKEDKINFFNNGKPKAAWPSSTDLGRKSSLPLVRRRSLSCRVSVYNRAGSEDSGNKDSALKKRRASRIGSYNGAGKEEADNVGDIWARYVERASLPGLSYLYTSRTKFAKMAWRLMLLVATIAVSLHLYYLVNTFLAWPKHTQVTLGFHALQFPAVTLCNVNPLRYSKIADASPELRDLVEATKPGRLAQQMAALEIEDMYAHLKTGLQEGAEGTMFEEGVDNSFEVLEDIFSAGMEGLENHKEERKDGKAKHGPQQAPPNTSDDGTYTLTTMANDMNDGGEARNRSDRNNRGTEIGASEIGERILDIFRGKRSPQTGTTDTPCGESNDSDCTTSAHSSNRKRGPRRPGLENNPDRNRTRDGNGTWVDLNVTTVNSSSGMTQDDGSDFNYVDDSVQTTEHPGVTTNATGPPRRTSSNQANSTSDVIEDSDAEDVIDFIHALDLGVVSADTRGEVERSVYNEGRDYFKDASVTASLSRHFISLFTMEKTRKRVNMGHQIKDMLVDCAFQGGRCSHRDFKLFTTPTFGNCFTMDYPDLVVLRSGPDNGLTMLLYLEHDDYLKGLTSSSGAQVVIHQSNTFAFPATDGLALAAGMEINIAIKMTHISRLAKPWGNCEDGHSFEKTFQHAYTRKTCQHFCEHALVAANCGCYDADNAEVEEIVEALDIADIPKTGKRCRSKKDLECMVNIQKQYLLGYLDCDCRNPCQDTTYTKMISSRQWPSDEYAEVLIQALCAHVSEEKCKIYKEIDKREFALNFIKINIFYEDLNYENITEQESYQVTQFWSDIGGALGLWMGVSAIAVLEFLHLLTSLLRLVTSQMGLYFKHHVRELFGTRKA